MAKSKRKTYHRKPTVPIDDEQRSEIIDRLLNGEESKEIAKSMGLKQIQIAAVKAHITSGTYDL